MAAKSTDKKNQKPKSQNTNQNQKKVIGGCRREGDLMQMHSSTTQH